MTLCITLVGNYDGVTFVGEFIRFIDMLGW